MCINNTANYLVLTKIKEIFDFVVSDKILLLSVPKCSTLLLSDLKSNNNNFISRNLESSEMILLHDIISFVLSNFSPIFTVFILFSDNPESVHFVGLAMIPRLRVTFWLFINQIQLGWMVTIIM